MGTEVENEARIAIPRSRVNDYTHEMAAMRRGFILESTGADLTHVAQYSFDPAILPGNIENFIGVAQVPMGVVGPILINGEFANGEFFVPLATTEGTVISSYNRGMRVLTESGGIRTTVVEDAMQRAPAFMLGNARLARSFGHWIVEHYAEIKREADATTSIGRLIRIEQFAVGPIRYLRFNYTTGDAAGQNMTGKATQAACEWIRDNCPFRTSYYLSGNIDTDKKHSQLNMLLTRGKRVVAEAVIPEQLLRRYLHIETEDICRIREVQISGAFLAGSSSTGAHAANGLAALFIATGQDVANIAESHASLTYTQALENGDFYWSITLPSLIVATFGGGTGLATQRQCLEMMDCYGQGKVNKFAEICAAVVLSGEISLVAAILHGDWVSAHERLGRNRK